MLPGLKTVGFCGHRKLADPNTAAIGIRNALDRLASKLRSLTAICSAASGSDTLFLEEVARRQWPYELILPFSRERFEKDFTAAEWRCVLPFFEHALCIEEIRGVNLEKEAYMRAGMLTVEKTDVMIFVWDGKPAAGLGGTGDVVKYARRLKKPIIVVEPKTGEIREERFGAPAPEANQ